MSLVVEWITNRWMASDLDIRLTNLQNSLPIEFQQFNRRSSSSRLGNHVQPVCRPAEVV